MTQCGCKEYHIKLVFIRHGFSCANEAKYHGDITKYIAKTVSDRYRDPSLTNYAVKDIIAAQLMTEKLEINHPIAVFSSTLLRAQQTAYYLFPENKIFVAPYISELGFGKDNMAIKPMEQEAKREKNNDAYIAYSIKNHRPRPPPYQKRVVYNLVVGKGNPKAYPRSDWHRAQVSWQDAQNPNYNKFIFWLEKALPYLFMAQKYKHPDKNKPIVIAVVGHGAFMKKNIIAERREGPDNIGMVEINFCWRPHYEVKQGVERERWKLHKMDQKSCDCPAIPTLKGTSAYHERRVSKYCDGVVFHGFPVPNKKAYKDGGENC